MAELQEKDFIHEPKQSNYFSAAIWAVVIALLFLLGWGGMSWYYGKLDKQIEDSPFLQVTNRELSLFLWQFPEHMRINAKNKSAYLTGFQYENKVSLVLADADKYVLAPPELLFLYHTWHRLISDEFDPRPISKEEFDQFIEYAPEWNPKYWKGAPEEYVKVFDKIDEQKGDLASILPIEVQRAFQGWKNYFKEGKEIENLSPTYAQLDQFIKSHPNYARNYWINIVKAYSPDYLYSYTRGTFQPNDKVPNKELVGFLQVGLYNYLKSKSGLSN